MHTYEKTFQPIQMQRHGPIFEQNPAELCLHSILFINAMVVYQRHRVTEFIFFVQPPYLQ